MRISASEADECIHSDCPVICRHRILVHHLADRRIRHIDPFVLERLSQGRDVVQGRVHHSDGGGIRTGSRCNGPAHDKGFIPCRRAGPPHSPWRPALDVVTLRVQGHIIRKRCAFDLGRGSFRGTRSHLDRAEVLVELQRADRGRITVNQIIPFPTLTEERLGKGARIADDRAFDFTNPFLLELGRPVAEDAEGIAIVKTRRQTRVSGTGDESRFPLKTPSATAPSAETRVS